MPPFRAIGLRVAGLAAVMCGVLRLGVELAANGVLPDASGTGFAHLYPVIDALIVLAVVGVFVQTRTRTGAAGVIGLLMVLAGVIVLRTGAFSEMLGDPYALGAALVAGGMALTGAMLVARKAMPTWIGALWMATFGLALLSLIFPEQAGLLRLLAAACFAAGMVGAGGALLASANTRPINSARKAR
jgi:drug/metabolite transporter (DMT)-like permease